MRCIIGENCHEVVNGLNNVEKHNYLFCLKNMSCEDNIQKTYTIFTTSFHVC